MLWVWIKDKNKTRIIKSRYKKSRQLNYLQEAMKTILWYYFICNYYEYFLKTFYKQTLYKFYVAR